MKYKYLSFLSVLVFISSCSSEKTPSHVSYDDIVKSYNIQYLIDDTYYFPAHQISDEPIVYQALKRFDLIFVGHDIKSTDNKSDIDIITSIIPGYWTHVLAYIGKDSDGFAYAVEMNTDKNVTYSFDVNGLKVGGKFYIYCLGNDYAKKSCPKDEYFYGIEIFDYMWAKRLKPDLREELLKHESELLATMREDLISEFPFQLPIRLDLHTALNKEVVLVDDGRKNGADCTAYFISLFEEVAGVCLDDVRMNAASLESYYTNDIIGKEAMLPEKYNIFTQGDIYIKTLLNELGYSIVDNAPRETLCSDKRVVSAIPMPDSLFNSPSLIDIYSK
jgi:hypothetical protein